MQVTTGSVSHLSFLGYTRLSFSGVRQACLARIAVVVIILILMFTSSSFTYSCQSTPQSSSFPMYSVGIWICTCVSIVWAPPFHYLVSSTMTMTDYHDISQHIRTYHLTMYIPFLPRLDLCKICADWLSCMFLVMKCFCSLWLDEMFSGTFKSVSTSKGPSTHFPAETHSEPATGFVSG